MLCAKVGLINPAAARLYQQPHLTHGCILMRATCVNRLLCATGTASASGTVTSNCGSGVVASGTQLTTGVGAAMETPTWNGEMDWGQGKEGTILGDSRFVHLGSVWHLHSHCHFYVPLRGFEFFFASKLDLSNLSF